jgi:nucleoside-diphosphate-sugar epimerase
MSTHFTILGANGFIGKHLVKHLREQGYQCDTPERGDETIYHSPLGHIIYAIGLTADFRVRPLDTVEAHVCLLRRLLEEGNFDSLTYLSSTRVYANANNTDEKADLKVNPSNFGDLYNLSKLMGESLCLHGGKTNTKIVRLSNIIGKRADTDFFIDQLIEEGKKQGYIEFQTTLSSAKDYLYIEDAISLVSMIALSPHNGIFNVAGGEEIQNDQIACFLKDKMGFEIRVSKDANTWGFTPINTAKVRDIFGFKPQKFSDYFPRYLSLTQDTKDSSCDT